MVGSENSVLGNKKKHRHSFHERREMKDQVMAVFAISMEGD